MRGDDQQAEFVRHLVSELGNLGHLKELSLICPLYPGWPIDIVENCYGLEILDVEWSWILYEGTKLSEKERGKFAEDIPTLKEIKN